MMDIINTKNYSHHKALDELMRVLQDETLNANWGYWHFSQLNLDEGIDLKARIFNTLSTIPQYTDPYTLDQATGQKIYNPILDLKNLTFTPIVDLSQEVVAKAEHWAWYQGPTGDKKEISGKFHELKYSVADKIVNFLNEKELIQSMLIGGIDTYYSFGRDHCGDDIVVETRTEVYVIHFGFSS